MRTIILTLNVLAAFLLSGCHSSRTVDLDSALRGTRHGEYLLVVITDQFVSFQNPSHKDQFYFSAPLSPGVLTKIKAAVAEGNTPAHPIHFEDFRNVTTGPGA